MPPAALKLRYPADLPIVERREELLDVIGANQVVVVAGETGSGKSTQLPKLCLELGRGDDAMIGHTQPRRLAARAVAERVAEELGEEIGGTVGYTVRFTDRVGPGTRLKVMTDGILLAEIQRDRMLRAYDTLIIDEAHERSLNVDFLLGYLTNLLPRRPDLKVIITSATIDTAKFAEHFGGAPVVEVSGRSYPVELRYRPFGRDAGDDRDQVQAIIDAVDELATEGPGDVLVFLSGEREIRDTADALRRLERRNTEVLPLYARLSAAEQHRVFASHRGRRIVLATNVAETSLTVPGIRYVVDPGTARISRYNRRTKVQRLPIEPVSQASADQRAGRCGRVAPGVCIRLYDEEDYEARPEFTDPEILRTNLASVILQMAASGLGDVARFPFVERPDDRAIADGLALLRELDAIVPEQPDGEVRLTEIGRRLARLPVDPRLGRMILAAADEGCVREVLVIAAALSIIDPRERPTGEEQHAAELHARFTDPHSDFLAYLALWEHLRREQRERSSNQFRKLCRAEYLNHLRVREWQDLHRQLSRVAHDLGIHRRDEPADPDAVHRALLAGLLSHVGALDPDGREYRGARESRFTIARGSTLAGANPRWVMAAELVETDRMRARTVARIRPEWLEQVGAHLVRRNHGEPWWDPERAGAVAEERVSLFGLPVRTGRIGYERIDPGHARELFIEHALVQGEWDTDHEFVARNEATIAAVQALEDKVRRRDILVTDDVIAARFDDRLPESVVSGRTFNRWWRDRRQRDEHLLDLRVDELVDPAASDVDPSRFPDTWDAGGWEVRLAYRFDPDDPLDGVTAEVPLDVLNHFDGAGLDWQVPGHRRDLVEALVRSLPKVLRKAFVPVPETVEEFLAACGPADGELLPVLARHLARRGGEAIETGSFAVEEVPRHLRVTFQALDLDGNAVGASKDLDALRAAQWGAIRRAVASATPELERDGLTSWTIGTLPRHVRTMRDGRPVVGFPALMDRDDSVSVRVLAGESDQVRLMWGGTRRLLLLGLRSPGKALLRELPEEAKLALAGSSSVTLGQLVEGCRSAAIDRIIAGAGGPPWDEASFDALLAAARERFLPTALELAGSVVDVVRQAGEVDRRLAELRAPTLQRSVGDIRGQLDLLLRPGFVVRDAGRLDDIERYLRALRFRLDKLAADPARDRRLLQQVRRLEDAYAEVRDLDRDRAVHRMLQELRVSLFAQPVGTAGPVSEQRVRAAIAGLHHA